MDQTENISRNGKSHCKAGGSEFKENSNYNSLRVDMDVYGRQNSMNEIKENDLSPKPGQNKVSGYLRQPSECYLIPDKAKTVKVDLGMDDSQSKSTVYSDTSVCEDKQNYLKTNDGCCRLFQASTFLLTILTLGLVVYQLYKMNQNGHIEVHHIPEVNVETVKSKYVYKEGSDDVSGSFTLDQHSLYKNKSIRWMADENSRIVPSSIEPCLMIPDDGKYLVISRFTFRIPPSENETDLTHQLELKARNAAGEITKRIFKRQYVSIVEHQLKENSTELRKSSNFIQSYEIHAGNEVCSKVSNPELLYASPIDNDVTIIKV